MQLGQYAPPTRVIAHISDTHFLAGRRPLYGKVDTDRNLALALEQLERSGAKPTRRRSSSRATWPTSPNRTRTPG
jgi:3',5'-cyclic-AMP phosphodiesterase